METALRQKAIVQPGGVIEIRSLQLPVGNEAEVIVIWQAAEPSQRPSLGWPLGFFELAGSLPDFPPRIYEGDYETRAELT
jgi:hypothetical protein